MTKEWFIERIGEKVYRNGVVELTILDRDHANYLHLVSQEMGLKYQDSK